MVQEVHGASACNALCCVECKMLLTYDMHRFTLCDNRPNIQLEGSSTGCSLWPLFHWPFSHQPYWVSFLPAAGKMAQGEVSHGDSTETDICHSVNNQTEHEASASSGHLSSRCVHAALQQAPQAEGAALEQLWILGSGGLSSTLQVGAWADHHSR